MQFAPLIRPEAFSDDRAVAWAGWLLRLAVLGHALGFAAVVFLKLGTGVGTYLFLEYGFTHAHSALVERAMAWAILAFAALASWRPSLLWLTPIAAIVLVDALARWFNGGAPFAEWSAAAQAARYLTPLALGLLFLTAPQRMAGGAGQLQAVLWVLRIGIAVVFVTHGLEALNGHPRFIDYILGTAYTWTPIALSEDTAVAMLKVIGVTDIAVGFAILVRPFRSVLWWMAFWGLITALSRVTSLGMGQYFEVLLRISHFLAPIAAILLTGAIARRRAPAATELSSPTPEGYPLRT